MASGPKPTALQIVAPVLAAIVTALATVTVAYIQFVKPQTQQEAKEVAESAVQARLPEFIEAPVAVGKTTKNTDRQPLLIIGFCGAATEYQELEGKIGHTTDSLELVTSSGGTNRMNFTMAVPPGWYYNVRETNGKQCQFRGWKL